MFSFAALSQKTSFFSRFARSGPMNSIGAISMQTERSIRCRMCWRIFSTRKTGHTWIRKRSSNLRPRFCSSHRTRSLDSSLIQMASCSNTRFIRPALMRSIWSLKIFNAVTREICTFLLWFLANLRPKRWTIPGYLTKFAQRDTNWKSHMECQSTTVALCATDAESILIYWSLNRALCAALSVNTISARTAFHLWSQFRLNAKKWRKRIHFNSRYSARSTQAITHTLRAFYWTLKVTRGPRTIIWLI